MLTPRYFNRTIIAGARSTIQAYGRHILLVTISASTVELAIDDDPPQQVIPGQHIDVGDRRYTQIVLRNSGGVPTTIEVILSEVYVDMQYTGGILGAMAASLIAIDADLEFLKPASVPTATPLTVVAQTGVGTTQIITAGANNKRALVQADHDNAGSVYLGFTNAVTAATAFARLLPGESWGEEFAGDVWACSENGTEEVRGYVLATV